MAAPAVASVAKWAAKRAATRGARGQQPESGFLSKVLGGGAAVVLFAVIVALTLVISLIGAIGGVLGGMSAASAGGVGAGVALSCFNDSPASTIAIADIPPVALEAYQKAGKASGVDWIYIAAIGKVETDHGRFGGRHLDAKGNEQPTPIVNGLGASGPMQFMPDTWDAYGKDGNYDQKNDVQNIFDAALGAAFYLKANGAPQNMRKAIFAYNHANWYVDKVLAQAKEYAKAAEEAEINGGVTAPIKGYVSVAQANIPNRSPVDGFQATMRAITARNPDFITLNEISARSIDFLQSSAPGYTAFREPVRDPGDPQGQSMANAVMWKTADYNKLDAGRVRIVEDDHVTYQGKPVIWDRFVIWALLERKSDGAIMSVISVHQMTNPGKFGPDKPTRQAQYGLGMDLLLGLTRQLQTHGPVFIGGDMNTHTDQTEPWTAVSKMGAANFGWYNNSVDYIFYQRADGIQLVGSTFGPTPEPDHRWVYGRFKMNGVGATGVGGPATTADIVNTLRGLPGERDKDTSGPSRQDIQDIVNAPAARKPKDDDPGDSPTGGWVMPMKAGTYTLTAHWGQPGSLWSSGYHTGQDFGAPTGTPVYAAHAGVVTSRPDQASWAGANFLTIDHGLIDGSSVITWYAHMSAKYVSSGQVSAGQQIGAVGELGNVTGPHLHFEVRVNGKDVDPMPWLAGAGVPSGDVASDGCGNTSSSGVVGGNGAWGGYQNGQIPLSAMCKLTFYSTYLECHAAAAMELLNQAYQKKFRTSVGPVGGYRDLAGQIECQRVKGSLCATPGTSNHGWGLAADLAGGGINVFGTPQHNWMVQNAQAFGWILPDWAQQSGSKPEPWHWEYVGTGNNAPAP